MANQGRLRERLRENERRMRAIEEAAARPVDPPRGPEEWWPELVREFGSEDAMFTELRVNKNVFNDALALVENVPQETRGRRSGIKSNHEKLLFLLIFMSQGVRVVELLVKRWIKTRSTCSGEQRQSRSCSAQAWSEERYASSVRLSKKPRIQP